MRRRHRKSWRTASPEHPRGAMLSGAEPYWYGPLPFQFHVGQRPRPALEEEML